MGTLVGTGWRQRHISNGGETSGGKKPGGNTGVETSGGETSGGESSGHHLFMFCVELNVVSILLFIIFRLIKNNTGFGSVTNRT